MRASIVFMLYFNVILYFVTGQTLYQNSLPLGLRTRTPHIFGPDTIFRERRANSLVEQQRVINSAEECVLVTSDEGHFFYKSPSEESTVCGIYMISEPSKRIEMIFTFMDVPCEGGGLVAWVDGWELNQEYFPMASDHPKSMDDRVVEMCGSKRVKQVFVSGQNVALLQYRIPSKGKGFSIKVRHIKNPSPCNILLHDVEDIYTIRNYGRMSNCSLAAIFPASIKVIALSVGVEKMQSSREIETGTITKCEKRGLPDYAAIGGAGGFDVTNMIKADTLCGLDSTPAKSSTAIFCEVATVRLVSSGQYENSITVAVKKLGVEDITRSALICPMVN